MLSAFNAEKVAALN